MNAPRAMLRVIATAAAALIVGWALPAPALASGGGEVRMEPVPSARLDNESLQRGARTFVNYCLNCHSAKQMRYNRLTDIGLTEAQIRDNLMFATDKPGDPMTVAMPRDAKTWFGTNPPDLSVETRVRGTEWLYNYFLGFYRDDSTPTGWNNLVFPNVAMPHVLWQLSGVNRLEVKEYEEHEKAEAAALAARQLVSIAPGHGNKGYEVHSLVVDTPGTMTPAQYRATIADLVNFLDYVSEPAKTHRINVGIVVLLFLGVLFGLAYALKREYWHNVH